MYFLRAHQEKFDRKNSKVASAFWVFKTLSSKCHKNYNFSNFE